MAGSPPNNQTDEELDAMIRERSATMPKSWVRVNKPKTSAPKKQRKGHKPSPKSQIKIGRTK